MKWALDHEEKRTNQREHSAIIYFPSIHYFNNCKRRVNVFQMNILEYGSDHCEME